MRARAISIRGDTWQITLNIPTALTDLPKSKLQKIFRLLFQHTWQNRGAIEALDTAFHEISGDLIARWNEAGHIYQREYRLPENEVIQQPDGQFKEKYTLRELRSIKAKNRRLLIAVEVTKREYEHFQERIALWNKLKTKYYI